MTLKFRLVVVLLGSLTALSFSQASIDGADGCRTLELGADRSVQQCDVLFPSEHMAGDPVYVRLWVPEVSQQDLPAIVFLHGRGNDSNFNQQSTTMIEHMGLIRWMQSSSFWRNPAVVVAPQDIYIQEDNQRAGNDYWLGSDGRDWESFLGLELPYLLQERGVPTRLSGWAISGISMGAHGALKMAWDFPEMYPVVASHSAVFQSTFDELINHPTDYDVFLPHVDSASFPPSVEVMGERNVGSRLLLMMEAADVLPLRRFWIDIHVEDWAMDEARFPSATPLWNYLEGQASGKNVVQVVSETVDPNARGHSGDFWRERMVFSFAWMLDHLSR